MKSIKRVIIWAVWDIALLVALYLWVHEGLEAAGTFVGGFVWATTVILLLVNWMVRFEVNRLEGINPKLVDMFNTIAKPSVAPWLDVGIDLIVVAVLAYDAHNVLAALYLCQTVIGVQLREVARDAIRNLSKRKFHLYYGGKRI